MGKAQWSTEEVELLKTLWPDYTIKEMVINFLPKTAAQVATKGSQLKLVRKESTAKRIKEERKEMLTIRNKSMGRDINYDFAKTEALKYKSKTEMYKQDISLYQFIYKNGHWDDLCSHMVNFQFNYSQMFLYTVICELFPEEIVKYNDRKAVKPLELDVYVSSLNLAFEYDGSNFHFQDDVICRDGKKEELCKEKGITLYRIKEVREERTKPENFILNQIMALGFDCSHLDIQVIKEKAFSKQISEDTIKSIINQYSTYKEFVRKEKYLCDKLRKKGVLTKHTKHFTDRADMTDTELADLIKTFNDKATFRVKHNNHFVRIFKRKAEYPLAYSAYNDLLDKVRNR